MQGTKERANYHLSREPSILLALNPTPVFNKIIFTGVTSFEEIIVEFLGKQ